MNDHLDKILDILKSRLPDKEKLQELKKETRLAEDALVRLIYDADCKGEVTVGNQHIKV